MRFDTEQVTKIIEETAAEEVMPRFQSLSEADIRDKGRGDLVTVADVATEAVLSKRLKAVLPGSLVLGEEAVAADASLFSRLHGEDPVWIIDPIDGTGNFARGRPVFAVMVGLVRGDRTLAGWIYDPVNGRMAVAEAGAGTRLGERALALRHDLQPGDAIGTLQASSFASAAMAARVADRRDRLNTLKSLSCAGWEYLRLLQGEMQFSLFTRLMPWDHVPGSLLLREAGGVANCLDGTVYTAARYDFEGMILAHNGPIWQHLYDTIFPDGPSPE